MKLALNGALTIGTLDGANIEVRERVGADNFFLFGLTAEEVDLRRSGGLDAGAVIEASPVLASVLEAIGSGAFSSDDATRYHGLVHDLRHHDYFMVTADFDSYQKAQAGVDERWRNPADWWASAIVNTARMGWFSSDRAIREYADEIWHVKYPPAGPR
jgi:starch phosphorylase